MAVVTVKYRIKMVTPEKFSFDTVEPDLTDYRKAVQRCIDLEGERPGYRYFLKALPIRTLENDGI